MYCKIFIVMMILLAPLVHCTSSGIVGANLDASQSNSAINQDPKASVNTSPSKHAARVIPDDQDGQKHNDEDVDTLTANPVPSDKQVVQMIRDSGASGYFITIHHLGKDKSADKLDVYRYGLTKALNSISTNPEIVTLTAIDPAKTVFSFDPAQFRLSSDEMDIILNGPAADYGMRMIGRARVLRGDWLVYAITRPEVYDKVMRIPGDYEDLEAQLGVDMKRAISAEVAKGDSEVTFDHRTLIRVPIDVGGEPGGYYWRSIDYYQFLTAGEFFFSLPNGLQGYMLSGFIGQRRIDAQSIVATDRNRPQDGLTECVGGASSCGHVINGESCMTCHANGVKLNSGVHGVRGGSVEEFESFIAQDGQRFSQALSKMGYDQIGQEPILETLKAFRNITNISDTRESGSELNSTDNRGPIFGR